MTEIPTTSGPGLRPEEFGAFFSAAHSTEDGPGPAPYQWQWRLLEQVLREGRWPEQIAAPTGAGKTAVIYVHVFAVALMAAGAAVRVPRRLSLVVDRRALVDNQYEEAAALSALLSRVEGTDILGRVAAALRTLQQSREARPAPLRVTRLRGGTPVSVAWRDDAIGCQIICATPDMLGSRLLFRGYGTRRLARPREAGLLAFDNVLIVDEAHLARQLITTARRIGQLAVACAEPLPVPALQVVETTATPDPGTGVAVGVTEDDLSQDPYLARKLTLPKPVRLVELEVWPLPRTGPARAAGLDSMAAEALALRAEYGPTVGCFANTVNTAVELASRLERAGKNTVLVCGEQCSRPVDQPREACRGRTFPIDPVMVTE